jgi:hypothetical protein
MARCERGPGEWISGPSLFWSGLKTFTWLNSNIQPVGQEVPYLTDGDHWSVRGGAQIVLLINAFLGQLVELRRSHI